MFKKILSLALAAVMALSLVACSSKPQQQAAPDLTAFYTALCEQYGENFPANADVAADEAMLEMVYPGLAAIETKQRVIFQPMMGAVVCEIALIEVANADDLAAVEAILQARIDAQIDGGAWYPESIEGWQNNSRISKLGNCIMMIAYQECDAIVDSFQALGN